VLCGLAEVAVAQGNPAEATQLLRECLLLCRDTGNGFGSYGALTSLAMLVARAGDLPRGVRLLGVVWKGCPGDVLCEYTGSRHRAEAILAEARAALGESAFARAWAEGQAMSLAEAVGYALREGD
jgi:hypothetical protein